MKFCKSCGAPFGTSITSALKTYCSRKCWAGNRYEQQKNEGTGLTGRKIALAYRYKILKGCSNCPEKRPHCLDFHHLNRRTKRFNISEVLLKSTVSLEELKKEIGKCVLFCANCHRVEENGDGYRNADRPKGTQ